MMAARLQASLLAVAVIAAAAAVFATPASGANYSWDLRTDLADWASSIDFRPGDQLVFSYDASAHDVVEVTREGYRSCSVASPVSAALRTGSDAVELGGNGWRYFICGVQGHCAAGMKLQVRVSDAECTWTMPPPAPPGAPSGINLCPGGPPTVIMTPGVISHGSGAAPVSSASLTSLLVTMVSLLLVGLIIV